MPRVRQALTLDPNSIDAQVALNVIDYRARLMPLPEAEQRFQQLVDNAPYHTDASMRMGMLLNEVGRLEDALTYLGNSAATDPLALQCVGLYLQALHQTGRDENARQLIDSGQTPWFPYSYVRLEYALVDENFAEAQQWLELTGQLPYFSSHGAATLLPEIPQDPERLMSLLTRLVRLAETGQPAADESLPADFIDAADDGLILHFTPAYCLARRASRARPSAGA